MVKLRSEISASTSLSRPIKRTYQRKKVTSTLIKHRHRNIQNKPLKLISPPVLPPPPPPETLLPVNIPQDNSDNGSSFKSPESTFTPNSSSSLHVKHTSNELFDKLLKETIPKCDKKYQDIVKGTSDIKVILNGNPKANWTSESSGDSFGSDPFDRIVKKKESPVKKFSYPNKKKAKKKNSNIINQLLTKNAETSTFFKNYQLEVVKTDKDNRISIENSSMFRNALCNTSSDRSSCDKKRLSDETGIDFPLFSSTPCMRLVKKANKINHISPITTTPFDSFVKKHSTPSSECISDEKIVISSEIDNPSKEDALKRDSEKSFKDSTILFDSDDENVDPVSQSFYDLKYFNVNDRKSKSESIQKLKNLIDRVESDDDSKTQHLSSENNRCLDDLKYFDAKDVQVKSSSINKLKNLIDQVESNINRQPNINSTNDQSFDDLQNSKLKFITKRPTSQRVFLDSSLKDDESVIGSSFEEKCRLGALVPKKSIYGAGKKYRRSINYIRQIRISNKLDNTSLDVSNSEGFLGFKKQNESLHSYVKNRRSTIVFKVTNNVFDLSKKNASRILELSEENSKEVCDGVSVSPNLIDLSKLTLSEDPPEQIKDFNETRTCAARDIVLRKCGQSAPISFELCYPDGKLRNCRKIGEGVYGEVFLFKNPDDPENPSVIKIIPIEGDIVINGDRQKKYEEVVSEIIIAMELSSLRENDVNNSSNFVKVLQIKCVKGAYPEKLLDLWDLHDEIHGSENDSPSVFTDDQLYIIFELANCGTDLEAFRFASAEQVYSVFVQVAFALAVAEEAYQFEHRDLHWGNVLVTKTDKKELVYKLNGETYTVHSAGVFANIIDYTLSRISLPDSNVNIYNDLASDPELFDGVGDYQFDVYRLMREKTENRWDIHEPYTNIVWLDYLLEKLTRHVRYDKTTLMVDDFYISKLLQIKDVILQYDSCADFVSCHTEF